MSKITDYAALTSPQSDDLLVIVDVHDQGMAPTGTDKKITVANLLADTVAEPATVTPAPSKYAPLLFGSVWNWPWRFWPDVRGAKGDGRAVEDATVTSGALSTLTSSTAAFTSGDVGKTVLGWTGSAWYSAVITARNSSTSVTISPAVPGAFSNKGAVIATDDTAAFNAIRADAYAYAQGGPQEAEIYVPPLLYGLATAATTAQGGNAQIPLPAVVPGSALSISLSIRSDGIPAGPRHWLQTSHDLPGAVLMCMRTDGALDNTFGPACVIGGPVSGYGGSSANFSNARLSVSGLTISGPYVDGYSGMVLRGVGQASVPSYSFMPAGQVPSGGPWPQYQAGGPSTDQWTTGLWMPDSGNNALADIGTYTCYGAEVGLVGSEHCTGASYRSVFNGFGVLPLNQGATLCHGVSLRYFACEETSTPIGVLASGYYGSTAPIGLTIEEMDLETYATPAVMDTGGLLTGWGWFGDNQGPNHYYSTAMVSAGSPFRLRNYNTAPGFLASPQAPPSSGQPWLNGYYADAEITLSVSGGTLSALSTDSTAEFLPASCTLYKFDVPSGHTYTPTFTGALAHKVKLL